MVVLHSALRIARTVADRRRRTVSCGRYGAAITARPDQVCPLPGRPRLRWPHDARLAFWVIPNVEYYQYTPAAVRVGRSGFSAPDVPAYASRDYGNRVGFWRMLDVLDRHEIRGTVNINLAVLEHFPQIRDAMVARDWDFCFHGFYNDLPEPRGLSEEERAWYERAVRMFHGRRDRRLVPASFA
jgi:allantoinase